jgi:hypothetical protein
LHDKRRRGGRQVGDFTTSRGDPPTVKKRYALIAQVKSNLRLLREICGCVFSREAIEDCEAGDFWGFLGAKDGRFADRQIPY